MNKKKLTFFFGNWVKHGWERAISRLTNKIESFSMIFSFILCRFETLMSRISFRLKSFDVNNYPFPCIYFWVNSIRYQVRMCQNKFMSSAQSQEEGKIWRRIKYEARFIKILLRMARWAGKSIKKIRGLKHLSLVAVLTHESCFFESEKSNREKAWMFEKISFARNII